MRINTKKSLLSDFISVEYTKRGIKETTLDCKHKAFFRQPRVISLISYYLTSIVYLTFCRLLPCR